MDARAQRQAGGAGAAAIARPEPGLRRLVAPNPSPMTQAGTNTWLLGEGAVTVIDPGPDLPAHLAAILGALGPGERIAHILVSHAHLDHSGAARPLAAASGAPVLAFGPPEAGQRPAMARLAASGLVGGGEGVDRGFRPDAILSDGAALETSAGPVRALHTPGHFSNHLCFAWAGAVFTGDTVMGWASSLVSPPDGDMAAFMASLDRLAGLGARRFYPGHGPAVDDPAARLAELVAHRRAREAQVRAALAEGGGTAADLAARIYTDTPPALQGAAARNVLAHLVDLAERGLARGDGPLSAQTRFTPA